MRNLARKLAGEVGPLLLVYLLIFLQGAWAGQEQKVKDNPKPAQTVPFTRSDASASPAAQNPRAVDAYAKLPLSFEANDGQTDRRVRFLSHGAGQTLFLTSTEAVLTSSRGNGVRMKLLGANRAATVGGLDPLPGKSNYFLGNDQANWRTNVSTFAKVRYAQIYPGVDLVYYGNQRELEYDFLVAPGADPRKIRLEFRGAKRGRLDHGDAVWQGASGEIRLREPRLYQRVDGKVIEIPGKYVLQDHTVRFEVGAYDRSQPLVIDPVLGYSTYLGGKGADLARGIGVDSSGNAIVAGYTASTDFPVSGTSLQSTNGGGADDVFVAKLNAAGNALLYSTYVGGTGQDMANAMALDSAGNVYVTGTTLSPNFPISAGSFQSVNAGDSDAFVFELNAAGDALVYSTFLGGSGNDSGLSIAVDSSGSAYVTGETTSANFPTSSAFQANLGGGSASGDTDAFVAKLDPTGTGLVYSTYLGGSGFDVGYGIAVDSSGDAYVAGETASPNFPGVTTLSIQSVSGGGNDAFVAELNAAGSALVYSTYLGGSGTDLALGIAVDSSSNAYVTGYTLSMNFPVTAGALQTTFAGGVNDAFVAKLNAGGAALAYSTYLGGTGADDGVGITVDAAGNAYVVGATASTDFPGMNSSSIQSANGGGPSDGFVSELNPAGNALLFSTYLGGSGSDVAAAIALDASNDIYIAGYTASTNFPLGASSIQTVYGGGTDDAFVAKLSTTAASGAATTTTILPSVSPSVYGQQVSFTVTVTPTASSSLTPTGNVTISDGSTTLGTVALTSGSAIFNTSALSVGSHSLTAVYAGDSNFATSTSSVLTLIVNQGVTAASVSAFPNPGVVGQSVTLTATITPMAPAAGTPTGTVTFYDVSASIGTGTLSGGQATFTTSALSTGSHSITVTYFGDANFLGSTSSTVPLGIQQTSSTTLAAAPNPAYAGQLVTLTAAISPSSSGSPSGNVTFIDGNTALGTVMIVAGTATLTTSSPSLGNHGLTASYLGDANFAPSVSAIVTESILVAPTMTSLSAPGVIFGTSALVTVSVSSPGGPPSGNVNLIVDGGTPISMSLSSGSATFNLGILSAGTHSLAASFPAQGGFAVSSAIGSIFVSQAPSFTSPNGVTFIAGTAGSFTVTTTGVPFPSLTITSGTPPTGVTFTDNGNGTATLAGTPPLGATGVFPLTITASNGVGVPAVQNFALTVNQPPSITSGNIATFTEGASGSFTVMTAGFPIPAISESPALPAGLIFVDNGDGTASLSGTPATGTQGSYAITISATNGVSPGASQGFTLNINLGPAITSGSSTTFTEQMPGSFLVTTLAFPAPALTETGALPSGVTFTDNHDGTATLAGTPAVGTSNSYPITISASNGVGAPTIQAFTLMVNATASISSGSTTTFTVGSAGFFSVTTSGSPVPALTFTGLLPAGVTFTDNGNGTATLSGTPAASIANAYPLIITATNGIGSPAIQNFTLVVNQGAAILTGNGTTFTVGQSGTFTVMTSGFPTPSIVETPPLPAGVTFVDNGDGTGTLSGIPAANTGGTYPITFTANNGVDVPALQTFTLAINQGPAITSSNIASFTEQIAGSFIVTATGNPTPALSEVGNLPSGLTFIDNGDGTALINGTPVAGSSGQYGFTVTASNSVLPNATQTFTLTVTGGLAFTSALSAVFRAGGFNTFTVITSGSPIPTVTESGALPPGVTFTDNGNGTATLAGTPSSSSSTTIFFTAHNGVSPDASQIFSLRVISSTESAPQITSPNSTTFLSRVRPGVPSATDPNPSNYFLVTTTGTPIPTLTAIEVATGKAFSFFKDNHDGTASISFSPDILGFTNGGSLQLKITATGAGGSAVAATQLLTIRFAVLTAPKFTSASDVAFTTSTIGTRSFTVVAGPYVNLILLSKGSLPAGVTLTDNHNGTATLAAATGFLNAGTYTWTFQASNVDALAYKATQAFTLVVIPSGQSAPQITSPNSTTFLSRVRPGVPSATDPNPSNYFLVTTTGTPIPTLTAIEVATGKAFSFFKDNHDGTASISFSPDILGFTNGGSLQLKITATGAGGSAVAATQLLTIRFAVLTAPKFTSASDVAFTTSTIGTRSFTVVAGPYVNLILLSKGSLPAGVTLTDNHNGTATLAAATGFLNAGTYTWTFQASNADAPTYKATQAFTLVILP